MKEQIAEIMIDILGVFSAAGGLWLIRHLIRAEKTSKRKSNTIEQENVKPKTPHAPTPGSSAHYEAWKAEREQRKQDE